jgi:hypothetical protein
MSISLTDVRLEDGPDGPGFAVTLHIPVAVAADLQFQIKDGLRQLDARVVDESTYPLADWLVATGNPDMARAVHRIIARRVEEANDAA